ncbi:hypothetical protein V1477_018780 [Vespula maculifrons]|uniref:Uncharacterized protein n=1 Tax=Vespula maculifrons TaxID=7453 RepID=A0ABD2AWC7_VESMC
MLQTKNQSLYNCTLIQIIKLMYVHPINRCNNYAKGIQVKKESLDVVNKRFNAKKSLNESCSAGMNTNKISISIFELPYILHVCDKFAFITSVILNCKNDNENKYIKICYNSRKFLNKSAMNFQTKFNRNYKHYLPCNSSKLLQKIIKLRRVEESPSQPDKYNIFTNDFAKYSNYKLSSIKGTLNKYLNC